MEVRQLQTEDLEATVGRNKAGTDGLYSRIYIQGQDHKDYNGDEL